jgi:hypothetical protein
MPHQRPHRHPCFDCGILVECPGTWEENYDGFPEVICREYHQDGFINSDFVCEECHDARAATPDDDDSTPSPDLTQ